VEAELAAALLAAYGPALGMVALAAYGAAAMARRAYPAIHAWRLRVLAVVVGCLGGAVVWRTGEGLAVGAMAGACATAVVAAVRARLKAQPPA